MQHRGKHVTAFTQGNDFTLEPANSILSFKVLEQDYRKPDGPSIIWKQPYMTMCEPRVTCRPRRPR
jgi:hypothetical protein